MSNPENNQPTVDIELSEEMADGIYSNFAIITHSQTEFVIDFVRMMPGIPKGRVKSRIILAPQHAKRLLIALGDNLSKFEEHFGEVDLQEGNTASFPLNFGGQTGQA